MNPTLSHRLSTWLLVAPLLLRGEPLFAAGDSVVPAAATGVVEGTILEPTDHRHTQPLGFANVLSLGEQIGTFTDNQGHFRLELSPGGHSLLVVAMGFQAETLTVDVRAGQRTTVRHVMMPRDPHSGQREVLAPAKWLSERVSRATSIEVYRLGRPAEGDSANADSAASLPAGGMQPIGSRPVWSDSSARDTTFASIQPVIAVANPQGVKWRRDFVELFSSKESWFVGWQPDVICDSEPGVGIRVRGADGVTDLQLDLECGLLFARDEAGDRTTGDFGPRLTQFRRLFRRSFPKDPQLKALTETEPSGP